MKVLLVFIAILSIYTINSAEQLKCSDYYIGHNRYPLTESNPENEEKVEFANAFSSDFCRILKTSDEKDPEGLAIEQCCYIVVKSGDKKARGCIDVSMLNHRNMNDFIKKLGRGYADNHVFDSIPLGTNDVVDYYRRFVGANIRHIECSKATFLSMTLVFLTAFLF